MITHRGVLCRTTVVLILLLAGGRPAVAAEAIASEQPAPTDTVEIPTVFDQAFEVEKRLPSRFPRLAARMQKLPAFFRDATLRLKPRSYRFDREDPDGTERMAWAAGGELALKSGKWGDLFSAGLSFYTSQRLHGPNDKGNTGLLQPDQGAINVLGQAYVQLGEEDGLEFRAYRQVMNLPYINRRDIRMIPVTHEAYLFGREGTGRDFVIGHVRQQKNLDSERFVPLSRLAGADDTHKGVTLIGGRWQAADGWEIGAISEYGWDLFNTFYTEAKWAKKYGELWSASTAVQYTDQRSVGDDLVGDFDTYAWGWSGSVGYRYAIATVALTGFGNDAALISRFGSIPSYNSMIVADFDRPGEKAVRVGLSHNLGRFGVPAWSGFVNAVFGRDAENAQTGAALEDRTEFNATLDYKPQAGPLEGLWVRLRYAYIDYEQSGHLTDFRLIINFDLPTI